MEAEKAQLLQEVVRLNTEKDEIQKRADTLDPDLQSKCLTTQLADLVD